MSKDVDLKSTERKMNEEEDEMMTEEQREAFDLAMEGKHIFLTGGGGTGKTWLAKRIKRELEGKKKQESESGDPNVACGFAI